MNRNQALLLGSTLTLMWWWCTLHGSVVADPQTQLLNSGCSLYNVTSLSSFRDNLNASFRDLRQQVSQQGKHLAKSNQAKGASPVYTLFQCRDYLSIPDCLSCFSAAVNQTRNCSAGANGARVTYNGCFLRYESRYFYDQASDAGNNVACRNHSTQLATGFNATAQQVLLNLEKATPKIADFSAATKTHVTNNLTIYAYAQCIDTITKTDCLSCLTTGVTNLQTCLPDSDGSAFDIGCFMRYSTTSFFADNQTIDIAPFLKQGGSSKEKFIIGGVAGCVALVLILLGLFACLTKSKRTNKAPRGDILGATELRGPINYRYADLQSATKNFSVQNKIGKGGFGDVYKGTLKNGKIVAVKKLALGKSKKMLEDFESEVKLISNVHHRNLVRLLGCCSHGQERILVFEYMKNKSVDKFLFGEKKGSLNWKQRYDVILGTARGLAYLHEEFHVCIIHRDIKTGNILLDDDLQPKIADFGLARLLPRNQSHLSTKFGGTLGYTAPEYAIHGQLTEKADTYSYGVVILEIISGQRSTELKVDDDGDFLLQRAWKLYERGMHLELVDETLDPNEYEADEVKKVIEIGLLCTQASAAMRPIMSEVVSLLKNKGLNMEQMQPTMPVFVDTNLRYREDGDIPLSSSNATVSTITISAR